MTEHTLIAALSPAQHVGLVAVGILVLSALAGLGLHRAIYAVLHRAARRHEDGILSALVRRTSAPSSYILPILGMQIALPNVDLPTNVEEPAQHLFGILVIGAIAWTLVAAIGFWGDVEKRRFRADAEDNLRARQVETRFDIMYRSITTIVVIVAVSSALMTFPSIRAIGATLLASAGIVGVAGGLATRPLLENLIAGIQIAYTQPIRLDDAVIVENEFGRIERITATYVVVRLWDLRRMIVPLTYFIDKPFQNWTHSRAELIGSVFLYATASLDVPAIRTKLAEVLESSPLWDKRVQNVAVTDMKESTIEVRMLVSARNAGELFDLRCFVREKMIAHVAATAPQALPSTTIEMTSVRPESELPSDRLTRGREFAAR